jgi:hypothetical protein
MEQAVKLAVEQRARVAGLVSKQRRERDMSPEAVAARKARFAEFAARLARMPILDPRSPREIMDDINAR